MVGKSEYAQNITETGRERTRKRERKCEIKLQWKKGPKENDAFGSDIAGLCCAFFLLYVVFLFIS